MIKTPIEVFEGDFCMKNYRCEFYDFCLNIAVREEWKNWTCVECKNLEGVPPENKVHFYVSDKHIITYCKKCGIPLGFNNSMGFCIVCKPERKTA